MGMYDNIRCYATLPGTPPEFCTVPGHAFQSKSLECELITYDITSDGHLLDWNAIPVSGGHFTGEINFYDGNSRGCFFGINFTKDGGNAEWIEYRAVFSDGTLVSITEVTHTREPALPESARRRHVDDSTPESDVIREFRINENLIGRTLFFCYGGQDPEQGHTVVVVYSGYKQWVIEHFPTSQDKAAPARGTLEVIDRRMRDIVLWDSRGAAQQARGANIAEQESEAQEYARLLSERAASRSGATP